MMRYPTEREKKMELLETDFIEYLVDPHRGIVNSTLIPNAPEKALKSFQQWQRLCKEQKEEDDQWPFVH